MVTRVYIKWHNGERTLKNFKKAENADRYFNEQERVCGGGTTLKNTGLDYNLRTGVCVSFREWQNGDRLEKISYHC